MENRVYVLKYEIMTDMYGHMNKWEERVEFYQFKDRDKWIMRYNNLVCREYVRNMEMLYGELKSTDIETVMSVP